MNVITIVGRVTRKELRYTQNERAVASFGVAVDRPFKSKDGGREVDFFDVVAWGKTGELVNKYSGKGCKIGLSGRMQRRSYTTKSGEERKVWEMVATYVDLIEFAQGAGGHHQDGQDCETPEWAKSPAEDDLPF